MKTIVLTATFALLLAGCATNPAPVPGMHAVNRGRAHYVQAERANSEAEALKDYLLAAEAALAGMGSHPAESTTLYREALWKAAPLMVKGVQPSDVFRVRTETGKERVAPSSLKKILPSEPMSILTFKQRYTRPGIGAPMVGFVAGPAAQQEFAPLRGFTIPLTAVVDIQGIETGGQRREVRFSLLDPERIEKITLQGEKFPVAADWTAPIVADLPTANPLIVGLKGLFQKDPRLVAPRLVFLEPYDPKKIPLVFVHGLLSTPLAWENVANELNADPKIRAKYQFWFFSYPTGNPIPYSALMFRKSLERAETATGYNDLVLIGHSMGGILSRLQAVNTGRLLWDTALGANANEVYAKTKPTDLLREALIFNANPEVRRIVFVATPHRGSELAKLGIAKWAVSMIKLPGQLVANLPEYLPNLLTGGAESTKARFTIPTSIQGLSPDSVLSKTVDQMPILAPYNSIIGIRGAKQVQGSSDGVVPYTSSHLDGAESELTVPTDHGAFNHPNAVKEIRRILIDSD